MSTLMYERLWLRGTLTRGKEGPGEVRSILIVLLSEAAGEEGFRNAAEVANGEDFAASSGAVARPFSLAMGIPFTEGTTHSQSELSLSVSHSSRVICTDSLTTSSERFTQPHLDERKTHPSQTTKRGQTPSSATPGPSIAGGTGLYSHAPGRFVVGSCEMAMRCSGSVADGLKVAKPKMLDS